MITTKSVTKAWTAVFRDGKCVGTVTDMKKGRGFTTCIYTAMAPWERHGKCFNDLDAAVQYVGRTGTPKDEWIGVPAA